MRFEESSVKCFLVEVLTNLTVIGQNGHSLVLLEDAIIGEITRYEEDVSLVQVRKSFFQKEGLLLQV